MTKEDEILIHSVVLLVGVASFLLLAVSGVPPSEAFFPLILAFTLMLYSLFNTWRVENVKQSKR